jgi:glycosidase
MKSAALFLRTATVFCLLTVVSLTQAEVMLQWFETDWDEMYQKMPKVAEIGYSSLWIPPPTKGPTGASVTWANVGYNLFDRFDIGDVPQRGTRETRYGTRGSLRAMVDNAHGMDIKIIPDIVMNHNGNGPDFREYPGMTATDFHVKWNEGYADTLNFERAPRMNWWYHQEGYGGTMWSDLANLADIRTEDHPLNADPKRFTGSGTDADGNSYDLVDGTSYLRHVGQYDRYPYYPTGYTDENAAELLFRWITWLGDAMDYDGLRLDAGKHTPYEFFGWRGSGFLHEAQWSYTQRRGYDFGGDPTDLFENDRDRTNAFIFAEILSPWTEIEYWYKNGTGNPMRFLDYQMKKTADAAFTGNMSGLGAYGSDFGPSTGITYVWGHDEALASGGKANLAYAYILGHIGVPMVYYTGNNIEWADHGRTAYPAARTWMIPGYDEYALGEGGSGAIPNLVWINRNFARGNETKRWDNDSDFFALERFDDLDSDGLADAGEGIMILALNDSGGDIYRTLQTAFPPYTVLKDFTGNNGTEVTVKSTGDIDIMVPGNGGQGWVVYAPLCADGVDITVNEGGGEAGTMTWIHPGGVHSTDTTQQLTRITADTITVETEATDIPAGITVDNIMLKWGNGVQLPVTNFFDSGRGDVSGRFHNTDRDGGDIFSLTFSTTNLPEGLHAIKTRAFTQRDPSYSAIFNTATKVVYVDRHGPELVLDIPDSFKGDAVLSISNPDYTAYEVFVSTDGGGEVQATMLQKGSFEFPVSGLSVSGHTLSVRATEYDYASPRAQVNESTTVTNIDVLAKDNASLALSMSCPDKTPGDDTAELPFFKVIASGGASSSATLTWEGYELPWNGGDFTNTFDGQVIQRDDSAHVVTNRLWGNFINGAHNFVLEDGDDTVVLNVIFDLYGTGHIDSDGDGIPDNVEMPYFDDGAPGPDQSWPGDSNNNFIPESWETWSRLNPYNHSTFYSAQWDDRGDMDGDGASNYDEVYAGYLEEDNIYFYDIYDAGSTPSGSGSVASVATVLPTSISTGDVVTITYTPNDGTLSGVSPVVMHIGHSFKTEGSWQDVIDTNMTASGDSWTGTYTVPDTATSVDVTFHDGGSIWDGSDWQFNVSGAEGPEFIMDAQLDSAAYEIAEYNGMKLWAAVRGSTLYVATWGTGTNGAIRNDHFVVMGDDLGDAAANAWAKEGYAFLGSNYVYLAGEGGNDWSGWFETSGVTTSANSNVGGTYNYLEGTIDLADNYGSIPEALYMAVGVFGSNDGDPLVAQVPAMWDDNSNIEVMELLRVPIASITDNTYDGQFDMGSPVMYTIVNDDTNNANYGLRRFFLNEVNGDQEHISVQLEPNVGGTNVLSEVELFSNLNRRDYAKLPGDEDPDSVTTTGIDTYYLAHTMTDEGGGIYTVSLPVNRCGAYRINARWKVNGGDWVYYTDNGLRRDCAVVVSPKKALDTTLYELNPLTAEATGDQFADRSTFLNMVLDDVDRPNGISTNKLLELGVNMVWLQPIHPIGTVGREIDPSTGLDYDPGSPYAVQDYFQVNTVLGNPSSESQAMTEFTNFVAAYDANGIGVMLDGTFNHSAWDCRIGAMATELDLKDGLGVSVDPTNLISTARPAWYSMTDDYGSPASYFNSTSDTDVAVAPDRIDFGKWSDAADFFFGRYACLVQQPASDPGWVWSSSWNNRYLREDDLFEGFTSDSTRELWEYFASYPIYWLEKTGHPDGTPKAESYKGIDGLRCDFAQGLPSLFWEYAINKTRGVKWDFLFMAESLDGYREVNGSKRHGVGYRSSRHFDILNENMLYLWRDQFFNYRTYAGQTSNVPNRTTALIWNAFDARKNAFELSPVLLNLISHDEIYPTDDQWSLVYAYAINTAMDGVPMIFYGQEMGAQNDDGEYGGRSDFSEGIDAGNNFDRYETNFGKSIPHFKRYNHMTNLWNDAAWKDDIREAYGRLNAARDNSPALKSQQNYFIADAATSNWNENIFAVAKFQEPGVSVATQDVVFAFINNDFRSNGERAASFDLDATTAGGDNWFGIDATHVYNVVDIASETPTNLLWGGGITGATLIANGIYVGFQTNTSFSGGQAQYIRLLDTTAGMGPTNVNDMFANDDRIPAPVIAPVTNRTLAVSNTLDITVVVTEDPADTVTLTCQSSLETNNWTFTAPNLFSFTPMPDETGTHSFLFTATGIDGYDEELITVTVTPVESPTDYDQWATAAGMDPEGPLGGLTDDYDSDGRTNEEEYWSDTSPTNENSFLQITAIAISGQDLTLSMDKDSAAPRSYVVHSAPSNLVGDSWNWSILGTNQSTDGIIPMNRTNQFLMFKVTIPAPAP